LPADAAEQPAEQHTPAAAGEEEAQKVSHTDVEATWNKPASRQEKEVASEKPWWEDSSSSASPADLGDAKVEEAPAAVTEPASAVVAEEQPAAVPVPSHHNNEDENSHNKNFQPLKPHHSVNQPVAAHNNNDD
jgi:hypothetical protein